MTFEEYQRLKELADDSQRKADRAAGALSQLKKRLLTEFKCKTVAQADKLLLKMKRELAEKQAEVDKKEFAFKKKWGKKLTDD